ncbi:MAG: hypothetical protein ACRDGV_10085 [Candidatus Limnocylindria bacterium]
MKLGRSGIVISALLLLVAGGVAIATASLLSPAPRGPIGALTPSPAQPTAATSPATQPPLDSTPAPAEGVAGSLSLVSDFDLLPTNSRIDGWTLTEGARLETAAQPTAVDRSARLDGAGTAIACQDLDIELSMLEAVFMVDSVPPGQVTLLTLALEGGSTQRLTLTDGSATLAATGQPVELESGIWYGWAVTNGGEGFRTSLLAADGTLLADAVTPVREGDARATEFCMTAAPSTRLYLSYLRLEAR